MQTASKYNRARIETTLAKVGTVPFQGETVHAYINHGRWVADCPCNGAELVAPDHNMLCGSCGAEHTVKFPGPKTKQKIERLLSLRSAPIYQNWQGESTNELEAENIENGIWEDM